MNLAGLLTGGVIETVGKVVDDLVTTDKERMQLELQAEELSQKVDLAQIDVNKAEAQSASIFTAGWRPAIGWVCALALALVYVPRALIMAAAWGYQAWVILSQWNGGGAMPPLPAYPDLGVTDLLALVGAMLGMATLRHRETLAGKARSAPLGAARQADPSQQEAP